MGEMMLKGLPEKILIQAFTRFVFVWMIIICTTSCFSVRSNNQFSYSKLTGEEYKNALDVAGSHYLIDVRTSSEFRKSHIPGAVNASLLSFRYKQLVDTLNREVPVFIYCQTCHRSPFAARKMKKLGFVKVYDLEGGYAKWDKESTY